MKILFCHIPKAAGTSVGVHIAKQFPPNQVYAVDQISNTVSDLVRDMHSVVDRVSLIAGHIPLAQIEPILDRFDLIVAVVRHPIDRLLSMHKFMKMMGYIDSSIPFEEFFRTTYSGNIHTRNEQCGYIGHENVFQSVLTRMDQIPSLRLFTIEQMEERLPTVLEEFNLSAAGMERLNVSQNSTVRWGDLPRSLHREIYGWFDGDVLLYDYLSETQTVGARKVA